MPLLVEQASLLHRYLILFFLACFERKYPKYLQKSMFTRTFALDHSYFGKLCLSRLAELFRLLANSIKEEGVGGVPSPLKTSNSFFMKNKHFS